MRKKINKSLQQGFTVIEILLYMGIFSILLIVLMQFFTMILSTHAESQSTSSIDQDARFILNRLSYDIHDATTVSSPTLGSSCTWPAVPGCQLVFSNGTYSVVSGDLNLTQGGVANVLNSNKTTLTSITFETRGNSAAGSKKSVQIKFTLQSKINTNTAKSFQLTVSTR